MKPEDLISQARRLARMGGQRPRQADLRRAVSTAYYALFHALCRTCSDCFVGATAAARSTRAWQQVYRGVDHHHARKQFQNTQTLNRFPPDIQTFANEFVRCQIERHRADYDPFQRYSRQQVLDLIDDAETALQNLRGAPLTDRRAFAVWAILKSRT